MYVFTVPTSSALSVNSSGLSLTVTSGYPSDPFGFRIKKISLALVQVSYLKGSMVVNLYEFSQPIREPFRPPLTEVRHDVLYEAISIILLVRQQLQRINQIAAKALIPAATDPVFLLAFLLRPPVETFLLLLFLGKNIPTFLARVVLFPSFSKVFHDAPFFLHKFMSLPPCQWFVSFCSQRLVVAFLA